MNRDAVIDVVDELLAVGATRAGGHLFRDSTSTSRRALYWRDGQRLSVYSCGAGADGVSDDVLLMYLRTGKDARVTFLWMSGWLFAQYAIDNGWEQQEVFAEQPEAPSETVISTPTGGTQHDFLGMALKGIK